MLETTITMMMTHVIYLLSRIRWYWKASFCLQTKYEASYQIDIAMLMLIDCIDLYCIPFFIPNSNKIIALGKPKAFAP